MAIIIVPANPATDWWSLAAVRKVRRKAEHSLLQNDDYCRLLYLPNTLMLMP